MTLHLVLDRLVAERGADLLLHLIEGLGLTVLALAHHDDVVAVLRLHHVAELAGLEREGDLVELGHHAPRAEGAEVAALPRDLGSFVVARRRALRVEEVVHDEVLDELPLALRRRQVGARRGRRALELLRDAAAGQRVPLVGGDALAPRLAGGALGRRGSAAALLVLLAAGRREGGEDERARAPGAGAHTAKCHTPGLAGSQFCAAAYRAVDDPRRAAAPPRACVRGTAVAA